MFYLQKLYRIRIVYKTGYIHEFECIDFTATQNGYKWVVDTHKNRPISIGIDSIAAVWQVGVRTAVRWKKRK